MYIQIDTLKLFSRDQLQALFVDPYVCFPPDSDMTDGVLNEFGFATLSSGVMPTIDYSTQKLVASDPVNNGTGWVTSYVIVDLTSDELAALVKGLEFSITNQVQSRLDLFAKSRGYDGIMSACTYSSSKVDRLRVEGQYCVDSRDSTWEVLYGILASVQAGTAPTPHSYADIESQLPVLAWPIATVT